MHKLKWSSRAFDSRLISKQYRQVVGSPHHRRVSRSSNGSLWSSDDGHKSQLRVAVAYFLIFPAHNSLISLQYGATQGTEYILDWFLNATCSRQWEYGLSSPPCPLLITFSLPCTRIYLLFLLNTPVAPLSWLERAETRVSLTNHIALVPKRSTSTGG